MNIEPEDVLDFWLREIGDHDWLSTDTRHDAVMRERFVELQAKAARDELPQWKKNPESMLALLLLLQEFPRRMFRGRAEAFANDNLALDLARDAIIHHFDDRIDKTYKLIFYLPYINSENISDQRLALFYVRERTKEDAWLKIAERNFQIIDHFGRFPDRNAALGRASTQEEIAFLEKPTVLSA